MKTGEIREKLYKKFGVEPLNKDPQQIFQQLSAFWQHFALYKRKCNKTGKDMISVFDENCPHPVWHREEWIKNANPPSAEYNPDRPFFDQLWELFKTCPISHNTGAGNENCEYTDDWWYGKNCYLCHSGLNCEDLSYCYRVLKSRDCQFCVFSFNSELSVDLINCTDCYNSTYAVDSRQCRDSAFLFDCRNCSNCLFCWNLRNKEYCINNKQLTKEQFKKERDKYDFSSRKIYEQAKEDLFEILRTKAWWKNIIQEECENCTGDKIMKCKNCEDCYMIQESEDCANSIRGYGLKDVLNTTGTMTSELVYFSSMAQDQCYNIKFCYDVIQCKDMEYSAHCYQCKNCFGCCGLVGKQYCVFNKPYPKEEYEKKVQEIKLKLINEKTYGEFFPPHFAACPYEESLAGFHWPLTQSEQQVRGYRTKTIEIKKEGEYSPIEEIPDSSTNVEEKLTEKSFWDNEYSRPFKITKTDLGFCQRNKVPLLNQYYLHRLKDNFRTIFFTGTLRPTTCAKTGKPLLTSLPSVLDGRIVSEEAYLELIH